MDDDDDDVAMVDVNGLSKDNIALGDATLERCFSGGIPGVLQVGLVR